MCILKKVLQSLGGTFWYRMTTPFASCNIYENILRAEGLLNIRMPQEASIRNFMNRVMFTVGNASIPGAIQLLLRVLSTTFPFDAVKYECKRRYLRKQKDSFMSFRHGRTIGPTFRGYFPLCLSLIYYNVI